MAVVYIPKPCGNATAVVYRNQTMTGCGLGKVDHACSALQFLTSWAYGKTQYSEFHLEFQIAINFPLLGGC